MGTNLPLAADLELAGHTGLWHLTVAALVHLHSHRCRHVAMATLALATEDLPPLEAQTTCPTALRPLAHIPAAHGTQTHQLCLKKHTDMTSAHTHTRTHNYVK